MTAALDVICWCSPCGGDGCGHCQGSGICGCCFGAGQNCDCPDECYRGTRTRGSVAARILERPLRNGATLHAVPDDNAATLKSIVLLGHVRTTAQMEAMPRPEWRIDGLIPEQGLGVLYGAPGTYKSFTALAMSASIATGTDWCDRAVTQGRVLYQVGEGGAGIGQRTEAWRTDTSIDDLGELFWLPKSLNVLDTDWADALVEVAAQHQPVFVVIDTLARAIVGGDENAARDIGRAIEAADRVREAINGTVLLVHHSTREGGNMRGSSALEGASDFILEMKKDRNGETLTLSNPKQKDAEAAKPIRLSTRKVANSVVLDHLPSVGSVPIGETELLAVARQHCPPEGLTPKQLRDLAELPERSFFRTVKPLRERGELINIGTEARPRLVPSEKGDE